ncbi:type II toxin-antitoxin system RatA family toxin [Cucumibacter marinus]|uniref:type II toxin-antitoxin system RatA family toxin n=1 Tax=Cucumibacter marinus TaxID=1121252 RepID=UPI00042189A4|nr:type II toxin-antitoxin system RatA family toxin [Cucumibacter marinus]
MRQIDFAKHLPYTADQMYRMVGDLKAYPDFLPNCSSMEVWSPPGADKDNVHARMGIQFGPVRQAYTSEVTFNPEALTIAASAIDGPFSHLDSLWQFVPAEEGCHVTFDISFAIANPLIAAVAEPAFAAKQEEIIAAFLDRARELYA